MREDRVWQQAQVVAKFLSGVRGAIPLANLQIEMMLRIIQAVQPGVAQVIDLGCGDGVLGAAILERFPQAHGVFIDFSDPMLEAAQLRLAPYQPRFQLVQADYSSSGWLQSIQPPFDVVVSGFSIHHQPDHRKREVYEEIYQMLAPGGLFLNLEHVSSPAPWLEYLFEDAMIDGIHAQSLHTDSPGSREEIAATYFARPDKKANLLAPLDDQCDWLREIGFQDVDCYLKILELALFGGIRR